MSNEVIIMPRNFVLLEEAEIAEKGSKSDGYCTFGIDDQEDILLHRWNGLIMTHPRGIIGEQILSFKIYCGDKYPDVPPEVTLENPPCQIKYNKESIYDGNGKITVPIMKNWNRSYRMINILQQIKKIAETGSA